MKQLNIAYGQVSIGDRIYNPHAKHLPTYQRWETVKEIRQDGDNVGLVIPSYTQWGHAREGVMVERP